MLPHHVKLITVVGAPLDMPTCPASAPSSPEFSQLVDEVHGRYIAALKDLYNQHKEACAPTRWVGVGGGQVPSLGWGRGA